MDKRKVKNIIKTGIKMLGGIGAVKIVHNISPYEGIFGSIACGTFTFFAVMAAQDMIEGQLLKCEEIIKHMENGEDFIVI